MTSKQELIKDLFFVREDCFARQFLQQNGKKGFVCVKETLTTELLQDHLDQKDFLGTYNLDTQNKVKWGVFDFDLNTSEDFSNAKSLYSFLKKKGFNPLMEMSRGGNYKVHVWIFSKELIPASQMKAFLERACQKSGVTPHEIFPKQTELDEKGFGNLLKLPLGLHLVTKERSVFLDDNFQEMDDFKALLLASKNKDTIPLLQKEISRSESEQVYQNSDKAIQLKGPHEWDSFFETTLKTELPSGISKDVKIGSREAGINNNILKNLARWLYEKGYDEEELQTKIKPLFLQYGRSQASFNNLKGWFKKCLKGDILEINRSELQKWCENYFPELIKKLPSLNPQEEKITLNVYTDSDLKDYQPEPVFWLIEDEIPKSEIGLLVGKRGMRKTFTALAQVISITSGKSFLGDKIPERKKVLYIDEEGGQNEIAKRTKLIKAGMGITESLDISFLSFENLKLNNISSPKYKIFEEFVLELKPDLIVVDTLQRVLSIEVDRDNQGISEFFTGVVRSLTKRIGCSWLFIHHMRKGNSQYKPEDQLDEIRGGSELVNYCRFVLMCEEPKKTRAKEEKNLVVFSVLKMSNSQIPPAKVFEFISDENSIRMNYLGTPEEVLNTEAKIAGAIKNFILEKEMTGEFRTKDILENWEQIGFKKSSLHIGLRWLESNQEIVKEKRGFWRLSSDEEV